jgi:predicted nuclease of predicted toxin-antitoxin system
VASELDRLAHKIHRHELRITRLRRRKLSSERLHEAGFRHELVVGLGPLLGLHGFAGVHWSQVRAKNATDETMMNWASAESHVVVTNDLDFGQILALTHPTGSSVVLIRGPKVLPSQIGDSVVECLKIFQQELEQGVPIVIDHQRQRVRVLPL